MGDSKLAGQFFDAAIGLLERVRDEEAGTIAAAGAAIADTVEAGGKLFAFGSQATRPSPPRTSSTGPVDWP